MSGHAALVEPLTTPPQWYSRQDSGGLRLTYAPPRTARRVRHRAGWVATGLLLDRLLGEPPTQVHPVVGFASVMARVERLTYADGRAAGAAYAGAGLALGLLAGRFTPLGPAVAVAVAGRMLRDAGDQVADPLLRGDLDAARAALPALVGRDPTQLDASGISAAAIESLAENTVDAVVAPVVWALLAGAPGVIAHRAANTMDAMVGHRSVRYARFGTAAARLDDAMAWVPARLTAVLVAGVRPHRARAVARCVRRDAPAHPSPNAGVAEAAAAAALGVELGGPLTYAYADGSDARVEQRPRLGEGPRPTPGDVARARRLLDHVELALVAGLVGVALGSAVGRGRVHP
ncbi:adenosylcobinamide-phosphate synthase CbiB [Nocardioidaceae bacterium]|nr:adenosylcobinamide-phosphate synthase CbiB [Nocardioidaceae bacterium]